MAKVKKAEKRIEKQLLHILIFFGFLVVLFFVVSAIFKSHNRVEYEGLTFTKERFGNIPVYHYYYSFRSATGKILQYHMYLRVNPALNSVPIEGGDITFESKSVYITLDTATGTDRLADCEDSSIAVPTLARFFADNQFAVKSANMDFIEAGVRNQEHITCENTLNSDVIQVRRGDETKVSVSGQCIDIIIGPDCKIMDAVEKVEVHAYLDAQDKDD